MRKKIGIRMILLVLFSICLTVLLTTVIFYEKFQNQVLEELKTHARLIALTEEETADFGLYYGEIKELRTTLIREDGTVLYDSEADALAMDNHRERPEVKEAFEKGSGYNVRQSDTLNLSTYYYAEQTPSGNVIRVSKEAESVWEFWMSVLPFMLVLLLLVMVICSFLSIFLSRLLIRPIQELSGHLGDEKYSESAYEEIRPFLDEIHLQHRELKESARIRQEFTANVSHELKTPLTVISGYGELLENGMARAEDGAHFGGEIRKNANRLMMLINDIIHLSQLDVMEDPPVMEKVELLAMAENCIRQLRNQGENYQVRLYIDGDSEKTLVRANSDMVEEILYNLCDNAIRYNRPGGHVWVRTGYIYGEGYLEVRDDGIGISKEDQERIFERFFRVDKSRSRQTGGTGLGLAIVKHIVEQHQARMIVESTPGKGTTMRILFAREN